MRFSTGFEFVAKRGDYKLISHRIHSFVEIAVKSCVFIFEENYSNVSLDFQNSFYQIEVRIRELHDQPLRVLSASDCFDLGNPWVYRCVPLMTRLFCSEQWKALSRWFHSCKIVGTPIMPPNFSVFAVPRFLPSSYRHTIKPFLCTCTICSPLVSTERKVSIILIEIIKNEYLYKIC